jgi:hypothetical protein
MLVNAGALRVAEEFPYTFFTDLSAVPPLQPRG